MKQISFPELISPESDRFRELDATGKHERKGVEVEIKSIRPESKRLFGSIASLDLERYLALHGAANDYNDRLRQNAAAMGHIKKRE